MLFGFFAFADFIYSNFLQYNKRYFEYLSILIQSIISYYSMVFINERDIINN